MQENLIKNERYFLELPVLEILNMYNASTRLINSLYREFDWNYNKSKPLFKELKLLFIIQRKFVKLNRTPSIRKMGIKSFKEWSNIMEEIKNDYPKEYCIYDEELNKYITEFEEEKRIVENKRNLKREEMDKRYKVYKRIKFIIDKVTRTMDDIVVIPDDLIEYFQEGPESKLSLPYTLCINNKNKSDKLILNLLYGRYGNIYLVKYNLKNDTYKMHTIINVKIQGEI